EALQLAERRPVRVAGDSLDQVARVALQIEHHAVLAQRLDLARAEHLAIGLVEVDDDAAAAVEQRPARKGGGLLDDLPLHLAKPAPASLLHDLGDGLRAALVADERVEREMLE